VVQEHGETLAPPAFTGGRLAVPSKTTLAPPTAVSSEARPPLLTAIHGTDNSITAGRAHPVMSTGNVELFNAHIASLQVGVVRGCSPWVRGLHV
jgi:hypothetical protein